MLVPYLHADERHELFLDLVGIKTEVVSTLCKPVTGCVDTRLYIAFGHRDDPRETQEDREDYKPAKHSKIGHSSHTMPDGGYQILPSSLRVGGMASVF